MIEMENRTPAEALDTAFEELGKRKEDALGDSRYRKPKQEPKAKEDEIDQTIDNNEIYRRARDLILYEKHRSGLYSNKERDVILSGQRRQVAYGIDKYPEPLNANSWSMSESMYHILDETIDKIHYLMMLRIQLEHQTEMDDIMREMVQSIDYILKDTVSQTYHLASIHNYIEKKAEITLQEEAEKLLNTAINNGHL